MRIASWQISWLLISLAGCSGIVGIDDLPDSADLEPGTLGIEPVALDLGAGLAGQQPGEPFSFTVTNLSEKRTPPLRAVVGGASPGDFVVMGGSCEGKALQPEEFCTVDLAFAPLVTGASQATVIVNASGQGGAEAPVSGVGYLAGTLSVSPGLRDFGAVAIDHTTDHVRFTVRNPHIFSNSSGLISVELKGRDRASFSITIDDCSGLELRDPGICTIAVKYSGLREGSSRAELVVSAGGAGTAVVPLVAKSVIVNQISIAPTNIGFGNTRVGTSAEMVMMATNDGPDGLDGIATDISDPQFVVTENGCEGRLPIGASCLLKVRYTPEQRSAGQTAQLSLASGSAIGIVSLSGRGVDGPRIEVEGLRISMPRARVGSNSSRYLQRWNSGEGALGNTTATSSNPSEFLWNGTEGKIVFTPSAIGLRTATLTLHTMGGDKAIEVSGIGVLVEHVDISAHSIDFGRVIVGGRESGSLIVFGEGYRPNFLTYEVVGDSSFRIGRISCQQSSEFWQCSVAVDFSPSQIGVHVGNLVVKDGQKVVAIGSLAGMAFVSLSIESRVAGEFFVPAVCAYSFATCSDVTTLPRILVIPESTDHASFSGWTEPGCEGSTGACEISLLGRSSPVINLSYRVMTPRPGDARDVIQSAP